MNISSNLLLKEEAYSLHLSTYHQVVIEKSNKVKKTPSWISPQIKC